MGLLIYKQMIIIRAAVIITGLFLLPAVLAAQKYLPVIDSTAACSWFGASYGFSENASAAQKQLEIYHIVEHMPSPAISGEQIADILQKNIKLSDHDFRLNGNIHVQCIVNCRGEAGDFQILRSPDELEDIANEVLKVFREELTEWEPAIHRGQEVDVFVHILVVVEYGIFSVRGVI